MERIVETTKAGFILWVDSIQPHKDGKAREFVLVKTPRGDSLHLFNKPATLAAAFRELADALDKVPASE